MASADDDEMICNGSIDFDVPVPLKAIREEHKALQARADLVTLAYTGTGADRSLVGVATADRAASWTWSRSWSEIHRTLEAVARRNARTLQVNATFHSDQRGRGTLVVDDGNRLHDCKEGEDPGQHRARRCDCLAWEAPEVQITEHEQVSMPRQLQAGPFTDHVVDCAEHGEVVCATSERNATFYREAHVVAEHVPAPLPLGSRPAAEALPVAVRELVELAAAELRQGRSYPAAGGLRHRDTAREYVRRAESALCAGDLESAVSGLLRFCVELRAGACP
ncbi:hypothetical protein [Streptomyces anulatus]|uniref:hypothetical protein n=1 Tax=Streptomyces anulatus TaxID=1892 RepID=UPI002F90C466